MNYNLINNVSDTNNHSTRLKELFENSDNIIITSPFLMKNFADFLSKINLAQLQKIHLITKLPPNSQEQIKNIDSLFSLVEFPDIKNKKIDCQISINNKLHGKIYIFKKGNQYISAIISSANFTNNGLLKNHEWGVEISDEEEIQNLKKSLINTIEYPISSNDDIYKMYDKSQEYKKSHEPIENPTIDLKLTDILAPTALITQLSDKVNYWLKPEGVTGYPIRENQLFNEPNFRLDFSKKWPAGVKLDDIVIAYGVGTTKILSIYKVISEPQRVTEEEIEDEDWRERWPWYIDACNLTPNYGAVWSNHNFRIGSLKDEYLRLNSNGTITKVGGKTLGGLNFGQDKLNLSFEFAKFIIEKVSKIDKK